MKKLIVTITILVAGITSQLLAQGDLLVSPVRIIFEGNKQKEEISLVNIGNDTASYSVSFLQYDMTKEGNFLLLDNNDETKMFADPFLRVFPRTVTLAPRESQVVRLQFRRKPEMVPGEYRSHLYFRAEKEDGPLQLQAKNTDKLMSVQITPVFGISIPVIIRTGNTSVKSEVSNIGIQMQHDTISDVHFTINRSGNISVYGDIIAEYVPVKGKSEEIGVVRGVAVYTSTESRDFSINLKGANVINPGSGKIRVRFTSTKDTPFEVYAEQELVL